ncbi:peroxiredoxin [Cryptosporangium arvum]|uniref:Alkyl hydroperoxide reductase E n=1 Tax=Cryptosporangium arvum DSM 44712 TaxID=927661 RepID=A0A011AFK6_9ACTN|nr:peroxiredoxin [Cryptosporangium arvum]EXG80791.1 Peroxiredoxin [Cryptosporangium arvum DSM 44712]
MPVEVGDIAPEFTLPDQNHQLVSLADFQGSRNVLVVFYPLAFSRVCSGELAAIREDLPRLQNDTVQVLTISVDSFFVHKVWAEQEGFDFPLLSDFWPHGAVAQSYGVFDEQKGTARRGTFLVDADGIVRWKVVTGIGVARSADDYAGAVAALAP